MTDQPLDPRQDAPAAQAPEPPQASAMARRFRGYLPVVVDVETGGFDWTRNALLEIAAVPIELDEAGRLHPRDTVTTHVMPAPGTTIDPKSLEVTRIDIHHPFRAALEERP